MHYRIEALQLCSSLSSFDGVSRDDALRQLPLELERSAGLHDSLLSFVPKIYSMLLQTFTFAG